jgi:K+/H+ antiporter YhaU regulatory subunit KhtT
MLTEGLNIFQAKVHPSLAGKNLIQSDIRPDTGCTVIALRTVKETVINPDPSQPLPVDAELILIGTTEAERRFAERFPEKQTKKQRTA